MKVVFRDSGIFDKGRAKRLVAINDLGAFEVVGPSILFYAKGVEIPFRKYFQSEEKAREMFEELSWMMRAGTESVDLDEEETK